MKELFYKTFNQENFNYSDPDEVLSVLYNLLEDITCLEENLKSIKDTIRHERLVVSMNKR